MKQKEVVGITFVNENNQILIQERWSYSKSGEDYSFFGGGVEENDRHWLEKLKKNWISIWI